MTKELEDEYQKTLNEIITRHNLKDLDNEENLFTLFDEFYKKHNTFSIFENSSNIKYLKAIKRVKEEEEKRKKSVHYLLKVDQSPSKIFDYSNISFSNNQINIISNDYNYDNIDKQTIDNEIKKLAEKLEETLGNETNFQKDRNKNWEAVKEQENLKYNSKEEEAQQKKLWIETQLRNKSMNNNDYKNFLNLLRIKKQKEYEKDPFVTVASMDVIYKSNKTWIGSKFSDKGSNPNMLSKLNDKMGKNEKIVSDINDNSYVRKLVPTEYGKEKEIDFTFSRVWKNFEQDLDNFIKKQYVG